MKDLGMCEPEINLREMLHAGADTEVRAQVLRKMRNLLLESWLLSVWTGGPGVPLIVQVGFHAILEQLSEDTSDEV